MDEADRILNMDFEAEVRKCNVTRIEQNISEQNWFINQLDSTWKIQFVLHVYTQMLPVHYSWGYNSDYVPEVGQHSHLLQEVCCLEYVMLNIKGHCS